jgi:hypothetical protein
MSSEEIDKIMKCELVLYVGKIGFDSSEAEIMCK